MSHDKELLEAIRKVKILFDKAKPREGAIAWFHGEYFKYEGGEWQKWEEEKEHAN